ncbi:MAG: hypothetical protein LAT84_04930, partial [Balneolia bacterium]|nr:hypothetical protein [Balneolia bacterium]
MTDTIFQGSGSFGLHQTVQNHLQDFVKPVLAFMWLPMSVFSCNFVNSMVSLLRVCVGLVINQTY